MFRHFSQPTKTVWLAAKLIQNDLYKIVDYRLVKLLFTVVEYLSNEPSCYSFDRRWLCDKIEDDEVDSHSWSMLMLIFFYIYIYILFH